MATPAATARADLARRHRGNHRRGRANASFGHLQRRRGVGRLRGERHRHRRPGRRQLRRDLGVCRQRRQQRPTLDAGKSPALLDPVAEDAGAPSGAGHPGVQPEGLWPAPPGQGGTTSATPTPAPSRASPSPALTPAAAAGGTRSTMAARGRPWAVSDASARLSADAATRPYFQPTVNWNGSLPTPSPSAWDRTSNNGELADTTANGGSTAFATRDTASLTVNAVNDAPRRHHHRHRWPTAEKRQRETSDGHRHGSWMGASGGRHREHQRRFQERQTASCLTNQAVSVAAGTGRSCAHQRQCRIAAHSYRPAQRRMRTPSDNSGHRHPHGELAVTDGAAVRQHRHAGHHRRGGERRSELRCRGFVLAPSLFAGGGVELRHRGPAGRKDRRRGPRGQHPGRCAGPLYNVDGVPSTPASAAAAVASSPPPSAAARNKAYALALQADGRSWWRARPLVGAQFDFAGPRYNGDGSLDTSFGGGDGIVTTDFAPSSADGHRCGGAGRWPGSWWAAPRARLRGGPPPRRRHLDTAFSGDGRQTDPLRRRRRGPALAPCRPTGGSSRSAWPPRAPGRHSTPRGPTSTAASTSASAATGS